MVGSQPACYNRRFIVAADRELTSAGAHIPCRRRVILHMEGGAAGFAYAPASHSLLDLFVRYFNADHVRDINTHFLQRLGLGNRTGKPVQNKAVCAVRLGKPFPDHSDYHFIRHQRTGVDEFFGAHAKGCLRRNCFADQGAG